MPSKPCRLLRVTFSRIFGAAHLRVPFGALICTGTLAALATLAPLITPGSASADQSAGQYVALGDSFASGFGNSPYLAGTSADSGSNNCQRSTAAYGILLAKILDYDLRFTACQGAVTRDLISPRSGDWGEGAQFEQLSPTTSLLTLSIGGNDAHFADVLQDCIDGLELLPFNTCYRDDRISAPVGAALTRLDAQSSSPENIRPYRDLFSEARVRTPAARRIAVGYPHIFPTAGGTRNYWPGSRCEGIKVVDQRWMVQQIDQLNSIMERHALASGFEFINPNSAFSGHELCGSSTEWFFPLLDSGRFHPTAQGHQALAMAIQATLTEPAALRGAKKKSVQIPSPNRPPLAEIQYRIVGRTLELSAVEASDPDGQLTEFEWYITTAAGSEYHRGASLRVPLQTKSERTFTLIVSDDRGAETFRDLIWLPSQQKPATAASPKIGHVTISSSSQFSAAQIDASSLIHKNQKLPISRTQLADVNRDSRPDLLLTLGDQDSSCVQGKLKNRRPFIICPGLAG